MNIKYAILNNETNQIDYHETRDRVLQAFWDNVKRRSKSHFHGTPYTVVEVNEDGTEKWYNDGCCEEIDKPKTSSEIEGLLFYYYHLLETENNN